MSKLRTVFLFLFLPLLWGTPISLSAQYIVGSCGGATHSTLQGAFNDLMTLTVNGTFTIQICAGTYVDQPALLGPVTYGSGGGDVVIRKNPFTFGPVILQANATSTNTLILLDGAQNISIEDITFRVSYSASRTIFRLLALRNGAGEVTVRNCDFDAYNMAGTGYNFSAREVFCGIHAQDQNGDISVSNCRFFNGGGGIFSASTAPGAADKDLYVENCEFSETMFSGVSAVEYMDSVRVTDCEFVSTGMADKYVGIEIDFTPTEYVEAYRNNLSIHNKAKAVAIVDKAYIDDIQDNVITASQISSDFVGIWQVDFLVKSKIAGNEINYYRPINSEANDTTVTGIYVTGDYPTYAGHPGSSRLNIGDNQIVLNNYRSSYGIRVEGTGNLFRDSVTIDKNNVIFSGTKHLNGVFAHGILIDHVDANYLHVWGNQVVGNFGIPPICGGLSLKLIKMFGPMSVLSNEVTFNSTRTYSNGILLADVVPSPGTPIYVGNNRVAMPANMTLTRGMAVDRCAMVYLHHNSVNLHGSLSGTPASIGLDVNATSSQNTFENRVYNNIFSNPAGGKAVRFSTTYAVQEHDYNLYFNGGGPVLGEYAGTNASTLANWQSITGQEANSLYGDPLFASNTDLHISTASPAYQTARVFFYSGYAFPMTSDFEADSRGFVGNREIGADELGNQFRKAAPESESAFNIFPNPSQGEVNIELAGGEGEWTVRILDLAGREVLAAQTVIQSLRIDLSGLPAAVYVIQASRGNEMHHRKLILK